MTLHAYLSASSSHRWLNCTKAPSLEQGMEDSSSVYAQEGSLAHEIGELILKGEWKDQSSIINDELFYKSMVDEVVVYTSYCQEKYNELRAADPLAVMEVEQRLDFSRYVPDGFGTGDCVLIGAGKLEVIDLKFGRGVEVDPKDNSQLMLYGLGALEAYDYLFEIDEVTLTVAQVRLGGISSWSLKAKDLRAWGEKVVTPKARLAYHGEGVAKPGDWCMFCEFKSRCKTRSDYMMELYQSYKDKEKETISLEGLAEILENEKLIQNWIKDVSDYALELGLSGTKIPGFKVVEGRSNRRIVDEEGLASTLIDKGFEADDVYRPMEINTITRLEKLVGKKEFEELSVGFIEKPSGRPTLAKDSDRRAAIVETVEDEFDFN